MAGEMEVVPLDDPVNANWIKIVGRDRRVAAIEEERQARIDAEIARLKAEQDAKRNVPAEPKVIIKGEGGESW